MSIRVLLAPTWAATQTVEQPDVTIEAEYGSKVWEGRIYTAAHHQKEGPYAGDHVVEGGRPSPCVDPIIPVLAEGVVGVSHFDLDTLGGIIRVLGHSLGKCQDFWQLAAFIDVNGPHKLDDYDADADDVKALYAWWAWSKANRAPRAEGDQVVDITDYVLSAIEALVSILAGDPKHLEAGVELRATEDGLNRNSFIELVGSEVIVRVGPEFCNHLYRTPDGGLAKAVVAFNTLTGSITISLADPIEGISCRDIVQSLWGPEAGGHDGIAGSPRAKRMSFADLLQAAAALQAAVCSPLPNPGDEPDPFDNLEDALVLCTSHMPDPFPDFGPFRATEFDEGYFVHLVYYTDETLLDVPEWLAPIYAWCNVESRMPTYIVFDRDAEVCEVFETWEW